MNDSAMEPDFVTEGRLLGVMHELMKREPIFDRREVVSCREDFEREAAEDYWETGASGRRYSRAFVWATLEERFERGQDAYKIEQWETREHHLREIAPRTYLLTYTLWGQGDRLTLRLTVWQGSVDDGWQALYHQGTVVT